MLIITVVSNVHFSRNFHFSVQNRNQHIGDKAKRQYAAMVTQIDNGVGEIADSLSRKKMWDNTVFIFMR